MMIQICDTFLLLFESTGYTIGLLLIKSIGHTILFYDKVFQQWSNLTWLRIEFWYRNVNEKITLSITEFHLETW